MTTIIGLNRNFIYDPMFQYSVYSGYMGGATAVGDNPNFFTTASLLPPGTTGTTGTNNNGVFFAQINNLSNGTSQFVDSPPIDPGPFATNFSVQWLGYFYALNYSGTWTFYTKSVDCSYLWIGQTAVSGFTTANALIDNGGKHITTEVSGAITLTANTYYPIRIQYGRSTSNTGDCNIQVSFENPNLPKQQDGTDYYFNIDNGVMRA